jgi:hypothetical protein
MYNGFALVGLVKRAILLNIEVIDEIDIRVLSPEI